MSALRVFLFGGLFGFVLSRSGASDYDRIVDMFLLRDPHVAGVIVVAIALAWLGFTAWRPAWVKVKPKQAGNLWGGLLFGVGWALTGSCPGTALAQLGEGKLTALATIVGIVLGTALYQRVGASVQARLPNVWRAENAKAEVAERRAASS